MIESKGRERGHEAVEEDITMGKKVETIERPTEFGTRLPLSLIKRLRVVAVQSERRVQDIVREALEPAVEKLEKQVA